MSASRILGLMVVSAWLAVGCSGAKKIDVGGACILNSDCNSPLMCTMGKCHDACHTSADCPTGQSCVNTNDATICQLPAETECSAALPCGGMLVCASDQHCRTPCQSRTACTTEQVCVSGVCAAPAELDPNNQLPQSGSGLTADGGTNACQVGPGGYCWSTYTDPGATATWVTPPTTSEVHLSARSASDGRGGMMATLGGGARMDLGQYDQLWFDADIPAGVPFNVFIQNGAGSFDSFEGCWWYLVGAGKMRYTVDLLAATFCSPSCGYDRSQIGSLAFATGGWGTDFSVDIVLTGLGFSKVSSGFGSISTSATAIRGLNDWCCTLFSWGTSAGLGSTASWVGPPTVSQVHANMTDTSTTSQAGIEIELPSNLQDFSAASYLDFDATVQLTGSNYFSVTLQGSNGAQRFYNIGVLPGAVTYSIPVASPASSMTGMGHTFDPRAVATFSIETSWTGTGTADITVTRIAIRGAGAGGMDAGAAVVTASADGGAKDVAADVPVITPDAGAKDLAADLPVGTPDSRNAADLDDGAVDTGSGGAGDAASSGCTGGPDGWCWFTYANPSTTAAWVAPPSATSAHTFLNAGPASINLGNAGVGFTFAADNPLIDLSRFDRILFTATASTGFEFVVCSSELSGCASNFSGSGTKQTYTFEFSKCTQFWSDTSKPAFSSASVLNLHWDTLWGMASSLDIEIVPDILFCLGTQCTANPPSP
jgi:hypothetical protein